MPPLAVQRSTLMVSQSTSSDPQWLTDFLTKCGSITGAQNFAVAVRGCLTKYAQLAGYEYQAKCAVELKDSLSSIEQQVNGTLTEYRYVDLVLNNGQWVECKGYAANYDPEDSEKLTFLSQAVDYARSGRSVNYKFKNTPPDWAKGILACVNIWENSRITCNSTLPRLQKPIFGNLDGTPLVKAIKILYKSATGQVASDVEPPKPKASNDNSGQLPQSSSSSNSNTTVTTSSSSSGGSTTVVDPYADGMFVATLAQIRLMPQTPSVVSIRASMEELVKNLSPQELEKMDEPYWYYGRMKW